MPKPLRIGYLIGGLGSGGSERQLTELSSLMVKKGHTVEVCIYNDQSSPYEKILQERGVKLNKFVGNNRVEKIKIIRNWIKEFQPDIVHGFMKHASSLAVIASIGIRKHVIIGSDFSTATYNKNKPTLWISLLFFYFTDVVATQTFMNQGNLEKLAPYLRNKVRVVRNGVDTQRFVYSQKTRTEPFRFLTVANVKKLKNPLRTIEALNLLAKKTNHSFHLTWAGSYLDKSNQEIPEYQEAKRLIEMYQLDSKIQFVGQIANITEEYQKAHALLHPSVQEGVSNAILEAMASGLPVVASRIADNHYFVQENQNGFLCDPYSPESMADAMLKMLNLSESDWEKFRQKSKLNALKMFGLERFVNEYEAIYYEGLKKRKL